MTLRLTIAPERAAAVFHRPPLGRKATPLFGLLVEREGEAVAKADLFRAGWPSCRVVRENTLARQMTLVRRHAASCGWELQTVSGIGYRLVKR